ncbi:MULTISPECIES: hypothetical protein [Candidatus Williamhamiltonella]|uniref:Uncharacterized protein n=1 Tax=Candidatus Williamhamiltonella defendens TaxID=138072 RepID=A0A2D3TES5_9ENTR|nr:hypothetical protein [Candidatus Hamiltonella defensa]ATW34307.1 hypothetical protein BJP43_08625 [Candidatus Hamiltonella defensa]
MTRLGGKVGAVAKPASGFLLYAGFHHNKKSENEQRLEKIESIDGVHDKTKKDNLIKKLNMSNHDIFDENKVCGSFVPYQTLSKSYGAFMAHVLLRFPFISIFYF